MIQSFLKSSVIYAIPLILSRGIAFFLIPLYTKSLSVEDYGLYEMILLIGSFVNVSVALEIGQGLGRYFQDASTQENKILYVSTCFWFTVVAFFIFILFTTINISWLSEVLLGTKGLSNCLLLGLVYYCFNNVVIFVQNQLNWDLKSVRFSVISIIVSGLTVLLSIVAVSYHTGLKGVLWALIGGVGIAGLYGLISICSYIRLRFSVAYLKEILTFSLPLVPSSLSVILSLYIDRLMINHYLSLREVAIYAVAARIANILALIMMGFERALTPLIYKHYQNDTIPTDLATLQRYYVVLSSLIVLFVSLFSDDLLNLLTTHAYKEAASMIPLLMLSVLFSNMIHFSPGIWIAKKTHLVLFINVTSLMIVIILNMILIPFIGMIGAAISLLISCCSTYAMYLVFGNIYYRVPTDWRKKGVFLLCTMTCIYLMNTVNVEPVLHVFLKSCVIVSMIGLSIGLKLVRRVELQAFLSKLFAFLFNRPSVLK